MLKGFAAIGRMQSAGGTDGLISGKVKWLSHVSSWAGGPMMKIVTEFELGLQKHPPIKPGTPDPYTPPK